MHLRTCPNCFSVLERHLDSCPYCGTMFLPRVPRLPWVTISKNERQVTHNGRHFFAVRCGRTGGLWMVEELDQPLGQGLGSLRVSEPIRGVETYDLSSVVTQLGRKS